MSISKCISEKNIGFEFELLVEIDVFFSGINEFKRDLLTILEFEGQDTSLITLTKIESGSTVVGGNITLEDQEQGSEVYRSLDEKLKSDMQVGNISILSINVLDANSIEENSPTEISESNLALIIGISVSGFILILIIVLVVVWHRRKKEEELMLYQNSPAKR